MTPSFPTRRSAVLQYWGEGGSPLAVITRAQADALNGAFGADVLVDWAMRYGNPAIPDRLRAMKAAGCERILLAPLYPQYCAATTATANDRAFTSLGRMRRSEEHTSELQSLMRISYAV